MFVMFVVCCQCYIHDPMCTFCCLMESKVEKNRDIGCSHSSTIRDRILKVLLRVVLKVHAQRGNR